MALTVHGNKLIVGGDFTHAGGLYANHIAAWNGLAWSSMGNIWNSLTALGVYNNQLLAGQL